MSQVICKHTKKIQLGFFLTVFSFLYSCKKDDVTVEKKEEEIDYSFLLAGNNTVFIESSNAFSLPDPGLTGLDELNFFVGNSFFNDNWVKAPSITTARDGLGPTINAKSCSSCHFKDGRGRPANSDNELGFGLLIRFSIGEDSDGRPIPHPVYGGQLQDGSILGVPAEGKLGGYI